MVLACLDNLFWVILGIFGNNGFSANSLEIRLECSGSPSVQKSLAPMHQVPIKLNAKSKLPINCLISLGFLQNFLQFKKKKFFKSADVLALYRRITFKSLTNHTML